MSKSVKISRLLFLILIVASSNGCSFNSISSKSKDSSASISSIYELNSNNSYEQSNATNNYSISSRFDTSINISSNKTSFENSLNLITDNFELPVFYFEVIDPSSNIQPDYKDPSSVRVSLKPTDSYNSFFRDKRCYMLLSLFDSIPLQYVISYVSISFDEKPFASDLLKGIKIQAEYSYSLNDDEAVQIRFSVSKDGRFGLLTADQTLLFYTDPGAISYETVENKIRELDEHYPK